MAIVSALEYNTFFRGLKAAHMRLSHETLERILHVLKRSMWLEELHLEALGLRCVMEYVWVILIIETSFSSFFADGISLTSYLYL